MSGTFTLDSTPINATINNVLDFGANTTQGFADNSTGIGSILGLVVVLVVVGIMLFALSQLALFFLKWIGSLLHHPIMKASKY